MGQTEEFLQLFNAPEFIKPYLHLFVTETEMDLALKMGGRILTETEISDLFPKSFTGINGFLEKCYQKEILNKEIKDGTVYYYTADFYQRLGNFCKFGNYHSLPKTIRDRLDQWCLAQYQKKHHYFRQVLENEPDYENCHNDLILLLNEAEECVDTAAVIEVVPCDCRMLADQCDKPIHVCLKFNQSVTDRSGGKRLTREEAKQLLRMADKKGLMHTVSPYNWREAGPKNICNCCTCCCYPFRTARSLGTKGKWPRFCYAAVYDPDKCLSCGMCTRRCHFNAFFFVRDERNEKGAKKIGFNPDLCWGCGLCANSCPGGAIVMKPIRSG